MTEEKVEYIDSLCCIHEDLTAPHPSPKKVILCLRAHCEMGTLYSVPLSPEQSAILQEAKKWSLNCMVRLSPLQMSKTTLHNEGV